MARDLQADQAMLREVLAHAQNMDFQRAGAIARRALAEGFEHPLLLNVVATCLEREGRFAEALPLLQRALALAPQDIAVRNALALCLQRLDRPAEALQHLDLILKEHPGLGFVHASKGNALIALGWLGRARSSHLRAVELDPSNVAAMASLASIASHRGSHDEARSWAEKVLAVIPNFPDAVISLATAELVNGASTRAEALVRGLLDDSRVAPADKARAQSLLGDVLDATGRYAEAFTAYSACNESLRHIHQRFAQSTGLRAYTDSLLDVMKRAREQEWPQEAPEAQPASELAGARGHVFLMGFPRSGTTLLETVLDGHPAIASLDEHELLTEAVRRFMREPLDLRPLAKADEAELNRLRGFYWDRVRQGGVEVSGRIFVDKYPLNTLKLPLIARLFPRAKILFARRDPREVVLACFRRRFRMNPATYELLTLPGAAALYDRVMRFAEEMQPLFDSRWYVMPYESLMADFETETRSLCEFLGLEWVPGLEDIAGRARSSERSTPSTAQLARGLDRSKRAHWKHYSDPLQSILPTLSPWVERFGYSA